MSQISQFLISHGGIFLFLLVLVDQSGLPIPAVPWLLAAGALAAGGQSSFWAAICWGAAGCLTADAIWFYIGQHANALFRVFPFLRAPRAMDERTPARSILRGARILTASKFLPFGTVVPLRAGALKVSLPRFMVVDSFSSVFYSAVLVFAGFLFHNQLEAVVLFLRRLGAVAVLLVLVAVALWLAAAILKRFSRRPHPLSQSEPAPLALVRRTGGDVSQNQISIFRRTSSNVHNIEEENENEQHTEHNSRTAGPIALFGEKHGQAGPLLLPKP